MWVLTVAVLAAPALTGATAPAFAQPAEPGAGRIQLNLDRAPKPDRTHIPIEQTAGTQSSCRSAVEKAARSGRAGQQEPKAASCFEITAKPAPGKSAAAAPSVWCEVSIERGWWLTRRNACQVLGGYIVVFDLFSGDYLGEAWMTIRQEIDNVEDPFSPYWDEYASLTLDDAWGMATTLQSELVENCPAPCQMANSSAWGGRRSISVGETLEGSFDNHWNALGTVDRMTMSYTMSHIVEGAANVPNGVWTAPVLRCDHHPSVPSVNAGCVYPDFWPELRLPVSQYREGAMTVATGNYYLSQGLGYLQPLSRMADDAVAEFNRGIICRDGTWFPIFPDDTCDEFAFARSQQSGPLQGVTSGIQCAEVYFEQINGQWFINPVRTVFGNELCVRGHVPGSQNSAVGGAYSGLIRTQRLLQGDPFWAYAVN
jgi:hypothetical protein